tara:strand:+ start:617 stop:940 length:324 start_codon:yes stop_codon:yes gene_type:complete
MDVEYEEFNSIQEMLLFLSSAAPPMKNVMPINSYKGFICSFIPLNSTSNDTYLMFYAKGELEKGIHEFDISTNTIKKVEALERADKHYFVVTTPKRSTIADKAIEQI